MSPPCEPMPGMRNRRSGARARRRRASSGYVAPTTKPHRSDGKRSTQRSTTRSYNGRPATSRSWKSPAPGLLVRASTSAKRSPVVNGSIESSPTYGATVAASACCAALSFARKDTQPNMIGTLSEAGRGFMRRILRGPLGWALAAGLVIAACGGGGAGGTSPTAGGPKLGSAERPIQLAITPSAEVQRLTATGNVIAAALGQKTGLTWKVSVPTSYAAQIDALCSGQVDVAFIAPLQMTLALDKNCATPVAAALRKDASGQLTTTYESQILVRKDSGIKTLADLKGKTFAFTDAISASGYLFPSLLVKKKTNEDPKTFFGKDNIVFAGGHTQSVLKVYNKEVAGGASFIDARVKDLQTKELASGMPEDIPEVNEVI